MDEKRKQEKGAPQPTEKNFTENSGDPFENDLKVDQEIQQAQEELEKEQEFKQAQRERD